MNIYRVTQLDRQVSLTRSCPRDIRHSLLYPSVLLLSPTQRYDKRFWCGVHWCLV